MKIRVKRKHNAALRCFVCGVKNPLGLHTEFFELEDGTLAAKVTPQCCHQSYPGRVPGGICTALLDETIGRAINIPEPDTWAVTAEITTRYLKPVPYDVPLTVTGKVVENNRRLFTGEGAIILPDGEVAVTATGKYRKLKIENIAEFDVSGEDWQLYPKQDDPDFVELPEG